MGSDPSAATSPTGSSQATKGHSFISSQMKPLYNSLRTDEGTQPYHEVVYLGYTKPVAKIMRANDGYWWIIQHNFSISRGYKTVSDLKAVLFPVLDSIYS
jgi:hypothetical protein